MSTRTYLIGQGYDNLRKHGGKTFATMLIICATMLVLGLFIILFMNVESNINAVSSSQGLQAFVSEDIPENEINKVAEEILKIQSVKKDELRYIDKSGALEDAKDTLKDYNYLLEGMEEKNPFPRSFIITIDSLQATESVKAKIESIPGIYKVSYNATVVDAVVSISKVANYIIVGVGLVMMVISIFIISNTIKLAVYSNKREIYIMKYIGATNKFIKYPFVVEGIIMGLASAIISWIVISLIYSVAYIYLPKVGAELGVFGFVGYSNMWHVVLIAFAAMGIFLGGVGSSVATKKYLKEFRPVKVPNTARGYEEEKTETIQDKAHDEVHEEVHSTTEVVEEKQENRRVEKELTRKEEKELRKREKAREKAEIKLKKEILKREAREKEEAKKSSEQEFRRKRKARRLSIILVLVIVIASTTPIVNASISSTQDKINAIDDQVSQAAKEYNQVQSDIKVYEAEIKELDVEVSKYQKEVDELSSKVKEAKQEVEKIDKELQEVSVTYNAAEEMLNTRLRVLYENGFVNMWEVLFSSESITDFLAKYNVIATLIENDQKELESMQEQKEYINNLKQSADLKRLQMEQAEYDVEKSKEALEMAKGNKVAKLNSLETSKSKLKTLLANLRKEKAKQESILKQLIAQSQNSGIVLTGEFAWPTPGVYHITALFRDREYYNLGWGVHYGTDIAKSGGCNVVSAQAGKVIKVVHSNSGYGNYVLIDHGKSSKNNKKYVTLYAHLKYTSVTTGQVVTKGQKIGYMGSTGFSTGTHLHFEIRENGTPVNAMKYYTGLGSNAKYLTYGRWIAFPFNNMGKYQI